MRKYFIATIVSILTIFGTVDLTKSNLPLKNQNLPLVELQDKKQQTKEGLVEMSLGALILLLENYLGSRKSDASNFVMKIFYDDVSIPTDFFKIDHTRIAKCFKKHRLDICYIAQNELDKNLSKAVQIKDFDFKAKGKRLEFKATTNILQFTSESKLNSLYDYVKEIIKKIIEEKVEHIRGHFTEPYDIQDVAEECIKEEILQVNKGIKILKDSYNSTFKPPKWGKSSII